MANHRLVVIKPRNGLYGFTFDQDTALRITQVTSVLPSGAAAQAGLEPGHIIQSIGDTSLDGLTVHQVQSLIDDATSRLGEVVLQVSSREELSCLPRAVTSDTTTAVEDSQPYFDSHPRSSDHDNFVPVANVTPVPSDVAGAEVNLRLVRKEAYRPGSVVDGKSSYCSGRPFSSESGRADQYQQPVDLLPASTPVPQINFKPRHTNVRTTAVRITGSQALSGSTQPQLGAVASLAIDGGLSPDQLLHIGCTSLDQASRSPPKVVPSMHSEDHESTVCPTRETMSYPAHPRHVRPAFATHQPILLSRPGQSGFGCGSTVRGPSRAHIRIPVWSSSRGYYYHPHPLHPPFQLSTSTTTTAGARRGSFPLQMTRVGGLILETPDGSQLPANTQASPGLGSSGVTYQSLSACTSPTSVKHPSDSSSSSRGATFFSSSSVPSPANTPPLPPNSAISVTAPISCVDIVRLGPGDTVTHALSGDAHYTAHSLIRMHYCPQPYVSLGPVDDGQVTVPICCTPPWSFSESSAATCDNAVSVTAGQTTMAPSTHQVFSWSSFTPTRTQPCDKSLGGQFTVIPDSRVASTECSHPPSLFPQSVLSQTTQLPGRPSGFMSPTGPQVARTVRHLRRIRHIFGDSLGYVSSANSASMGALAATEKNCATTNSLVELRPHGSRSVESVRPASLVCKCPEPDCMIEAELTGDRCSEALLLLSTDASIPAAQNQPQQVMVRFEQLPTQYQNCNCPTVWERYCASFVDDTLRLTRLVSHGQSNECDSPPAHLHLSLTESNLTWHSPSDLSDLDLPSGTRWATGDSVIGFLRVPSSRIRCQLYFLHRQLASDLLGHWGPSTGTSTVVTTASMMSSVNDLTGLEYTQTSSVHSAAVTRPVMRGKHATGRSSSLGLAGPPGGVPLLRAVGTAAASVGMPLVGRSSLTSWLHQSEQKQTGEPHIDSVNGDVTKDTYSSVPVPFSTGKSTKKVTAAQARSSRGRFHQAFTRMRRAATASSAPTARSPSRSAGARRFASSHGALMSSKSNVSTTSCTGSPPSVVDPHSESGPSQLEAAVGLSIATAIPCDAVGYLQTVHSPVAQSSPALLLATSVSPSPALQSPYLTYLPFESTGSAEERLCADTNNLDVPLSDFHSSDSCEPLGPAGSEESSKQSYAKLTSSSELVTATLTTSVSSVGPAMVLTSVSSAEFPAVATTTCASVPLTPHPFIPLPVPHTGPLALHKCPRSTLSPFVPFIVEFCVTLVERYGLNCVGLYRLSGSKVAHDFISTELRKNLNEIDVTSDKWNDIHAICGVLKTFLRNLPDSLFPKVMYTDFLSACRQQQREKRLLSIQRLLSIMECYPDHPEYRAHRATLRYLATHLARVSAREAVNKMTAYNLALVFAPNLVQPCEDSPELLMSDSKYKIMLVETVIKYHAWIFSPDLGIESGCSVPTDSTEKLPSTGGTGTSSETTDLHVRSGTTDPSALTSTTTDSEDPTNQPGRLEGDVQPLVSELLNAAADLPPPPSDTDLETAEEPGPSSDRPSDVALDSRSQPQSRPRFTSIPTPSWSAAALRALADGSKFRPELLLTQETESDDLERVSAMGSHVASTLSVATGANVAVSAVTAASTARFITRPRPFASQLGTKLDSLRHLSQGCLDQYTSEARQLGVRVAESRRQLETTVAQRMYAEQLLMEARGQQQQQQQQSDPTDLSGTPHCEDHSERGLFELQNTQKIRILIWLSKPDTFPASSLSHRCSLLPSSQTFRPLSLLCLLDIAANASVKYETVLISRRNHDGPTPYFLLSDTRLDDIGSSLRCLISDYKAANKELEEIHDLMFLKPDEYHSV
ncbi:unnamed protein product [Fasciola hepatica]|uniref:Rho GTPase-activating protein 21 n=1 Tax=Fasciola hepatica TaxID=6192 RepID=A0ABC9HJ00_FASHE